MSVASTSRNPGTAYSASLAQKLVNQDQVNTYDIYCPLGGCRCLLLRRGHAQLVKRSAEALEHPSAKPTSHPNEEFPASSPENAPGGERDCWLVTSPLAFENIGFTKGVVSNSDQGRPVEGAGSSSTTAAAATATTGQRDIPSLPEGARIRYLSCADCDCGPLGWHVEHKGSDLGRDVEEQIGRGTTAGGGGGGGGGGMVREFLIPVERCRYKVE